jgi:DNA modification methylase
MKPYYEEGGITIYHGDCREILPEMSSARLVVTDPPYVFGIASTALLRDRRQAISTGRAESGATGMNPLIRLRTIQGKGRFL